MRLKISIVVIEVVVVDQSKNRLSQKFRKSKKQKLLSDIRKNSTF